MKVTSGMKTFDRMFLECRGECPHCWESALPEIQYSPDLYSGGHGAVLKGTCQRCKADLFWMRPRDYVAPDAT